MRMAAWPLQDYCEDWPEKGKHVTEDWLQEDEDWRLRVLQWLDRARPGDVIHRDEGSALQVYSRIGDHMLVRNHEEPEYIVVVLTRVPGQLVDFDEMD